MILYYLLTKHFIFTSDDCADVIYRSVPQFPKFEYVLVYKPWKKIGVKWVLKLQKIESGVWNKNHEKHTVLWGGL